MRRFYVAIALISVAACGDSFSGAAPELDAAAADASTTPPVNDAAAVDAGELDATRIDTAPPDVDAAAADAGDAGHDASSDNDGGVCSPIVAYTAPTTCACFFAGSCPVDGGPTTGCIWAETPLNITGQPTCRGCGQIAWKPNPCGRCKETFSCACLSAYLDPGQRCCDGPGGPYLSDYACP